MADFFPPKNGAFRKLWMGVVGEAPKGKKWSECYKIMSARFSLFQDTGDCIAVGIKLLLVNDRLRPKAVILKDIALSSNSK